jgi:hypothetical protein
VRNAAITARATSQAAVDPVARPAAHHLTLLTVNDAAGHVLLGILMTAATVG